MVHKVCVGLNAASAATRGVVCGLLKELPAQIAVMVYDAGSTNRFKYPMMRKMFHDPQNPVTTQFAVWLDDDSCLAYSTLESARQWWQTLHIVLQQADVVGAIYRKSLEGRQADYIRSCPWYARQQIGPQHKVVFATGGFLGLRTRILQKYDYPFLDLVHNGGDVMLGELCRQQNLRLRPFREDVWVNADDTGRESKAVRRGASLKPLGFDYDPQRVYDHAAHAFTLAVYDPRRPSA
jgi:hypothetical protein